MMQRSFFPLLIFPVLMIALSLPIKWGYVGPYRYDPEYANYPNTLLILENQVPYFRDHPGTSLQLLGAAVLRIANPTMEREKLLEEALKRPDHYLNIFTIVLAVISAGLVFLAGFLMARRLGNVWLGATFQLIPYFVPAIWGFLGRYAPETWIISTGLCLCAVACVYEGRRMAIVTGALYGALMSMKVTCLLYAFIPGLLLLRRPRDLAAAIAATGAGFLAFSWPLLFDFKQSAAWIFNLYRRTGYGKTEGRTFGQTLLFLCRENPVLVAAALLGIAALIWAYRKKRQSQALEPRVVQLLAVFISVVCLQILGVLGNPLGRYLLPALAPAAAAVALSLFIGRAPAKIAWAVAFVIALSYPVLALTSPDRPAEDKRKISDRVEAEQCELIVSYPGTTQPGALMFSNHYSARRYEPVLARLYPDVIFYYAASNRYFRFANIDTDVELGSLKSTGKKYCFLLSKSSVETKSLDIPTERFQRPGVKFEFLLGTPEGGDLYRMSFL